MTLTMTGGTEAALCNKCGIWTKQEPVVVEKTYWEDIVDQENGFSISGSDKYALLRCLGCETVSLLHHSYFSEDEAPTVKRYPPSFARRKRDWMRHFGPVPQTIREFLSEIYVALENGSYRLCAIGIRALLEDIMVECVRDHGSIGENINRFVSEGYIAQRLSDDFRKRVIEAGHAAMHRGHQPNKEDIDTLLDITESLIETIYVHPRGLRSMSSVPPRK